MLETREAKEVPARGKIAPSPMIEGRRDRQSSFQSRAGRPRPIRAVRHRLTAQADSSETLPPVTNWPVRDNRIVWKETG